MQFGSLISGGLSAFIDYCGREGPSESGQFQGLPGALLSCLPSCLRSFSVERNVSILQKTVTTSPPHTFEPGSPAQTEALHFSCAGWPASSRVSLALFLLPSALGLSIRGHAWCFTWALHCELRFMVCTVSAFNC